MDNHEDAEITENKEAPGSSITLDYSIGEYHGINPYFVTNWDTYEMSEDVDHSSCSLVKTGDGYELTNIILDSTKPLNWVVHLRYLFRINRK